MKTVFFCGHKSRYGRAHLLPLLTGRFKIEHVVLAGDLRWELFKDGMSGKSELKKREEKSLPHMLKKSLVRLKSGPQVGQVSFRKEASRYGFKLHVIEDVNSSEFLEWLGNEQPELVISAAYPQIFDRRLLEVPSGGAVNFHPSLLPRFRGAHPHFWTIMEGVQKTGVTAHYMTEELDAGDLIAQREFECGDLTYKQLYDRIVEYTPQLINDVESFFMDGKGTETKQDESEATFYREDREIHRRIFWQEYNAEKIVNMSRTQNCFFYLKGRRCILKKASLFQSNRNMTNQIDPPNGTIVDVDEHGTIIKCEGGFVAVQEVSCRLRSYHALKWMRKFGLDVGFILE